MTAQTTQTWVIMANDRPQGVHIGTESGAKAACQDLARKHRQECCAHMSMQSYRAAWYWRTYAVRHTGEETRTSWTEVRNALFNLDVDAPEVPDDVLDVMREHVEPTLDPEVLLVDQLRQLDTIDARRAGESLRHALRELPDHIAAEFLLALTED